MPTYLIARTDFNSYVDVTNHVADKYLNRFILRAQEMFLAPLLGDELYAELIEDHSTGYYGTGMLSLLTDYVTPFLVYKSYQLYLPTSGSFMTGMGPRIPVEDKSTPLDDSALGVLVDDARNSADFYARKLYRYLVSNKSTYTAFRDSETKNYTGNLPKITAAGSDSRFKRLSDGFINYDKEKD